MKQVFNFILFWKLGVGLKTVRAGLLLFIIMLNAVTITHGALLGELLLKGKRNATEVEGGNKIRQYTMMDRI